MSTSNTGLLQDQVILISGSSQGIGLGLAQACLLQGARVVVHGHEALPEATRAELSRHGEHHFIQADLYEPDEARRLVAEAFQWKGQLNHVVNNAGTFADAPFLEMNEDHFSRTFDLNVRAYFLLAQAFARLDSQGPNGSIVCIGSINGLQAEPGSVLYDSSKGAILMLVRSLAVELAKHGIRVNGIAPGLVRTPLTAGWMDKNPDKKREAEKHIPLGTVAQPEDMGGTLVYLCSNLARYVTGQMIYVDGGISALQMSR